MKKTIKIMKYHQKSENFCRSYCKDLRLAFSKISFKQEEEDCQVSCSDNEKEASNNKAIVLKMEDLNFKDSSIKKSDF